MYFNNKEQLLKKLISAAIFVAAGVVLSVVSFPVGLVRCFPFQHSINVVTGVLLGPFWAIATAFTTSLIRILLGTGSLFAFPGSMFGALFVGITAKFLPDKHKFWAAATEPIGTGILGAWVSSLIVTPTVGKEIGFVFLSFSFLVSSIPGALIGATIIYYLRKNGISSET